MAIILGKSAVAKIHAAVTALFNRARIRFLGREWGPKELKVTAESRPVEHRADLSLPGLFDHASRAEGFEPHAGLRDSLSRVADGYLTAQEAVAKAGVTSAVQNFLNDAARKGVNTDLKTVLGGELAAVMGSVASRVKTIVETEATRARNVGTLDAVTKIATASGVADPTVYFVVVNDDLLCKECRRLHLMDDGMTPRVWKLSEVGHAHHKRGDDHPAAGGLHPNCRCSLVYLARGYGFSGGRVRFIGFEHDEYAQQRSE